MSAQNTNLESGEKEEKFSTGASLEIPGPTLLNVVNTPLKFVAKSLLSKETINTENIRINT